MTSDATTTPFAPAPGGDGSDLLGTNGEGKLLLTGAAVCCCKRNRYPSIPHYGNCYKPAGLSELSDLVFHSFIRDIQLSLISRPTGFLQIYAFVIFAIVFFIPAGICLNGSVCLLATGLLIWWSDGRHKDIQCEVEARIQEWQPLFAKEAFVVSLMVDKKWSEPTESYIHIYRTAYTGGETTSCGSDDFAPHYHEDAKYLLVYARLWRRRNKTYRVAPIATYDVRNLYAKPPALHNLGDDVFHSLMKDLNHAIQVYARKLRLKNVALLIVVVLICYFTTANVFVAIPGVFVMGALDDGVLIHLPFLTAHICIKLQEWQPQLASQGFTVEYIVDQPTWYSWKESYMRIGRLDSTGSINKTLSSSDDHALPVALSN